MSVRAICPVSGCGRLTYGGRCAKHQAEYNRRDNARRNAKQWRQGRNTIRWRRLRALVLDRDDYRCRSCGSSDDLTVHLAPELSGDHRAAGPDDLTTLCRSCHGRIDGARSRHGVA